MLILSEPWDFRSLWFSLTITAKFYIVCFLAASAYSIYSLTLIAVRFRQIAKQEKADMVLLTNMRAKAQTLREFHTLLLLLFGLCCSNELFNTLRGIQHSVVSLSAATYYAFGPVIAFAFFVFAVLLLLHVFRWAVAHRLQSGPQFQSPKTS